MWAEVGIDVEIAPGEQVQAIRDMTSHEYEALLSRWAGKPDPDLNAYQFFHSESPRNYTGIADAQLDDLLTRARSELDVEQRTLLYQEFADRLAELVPYNFVNALDFYYIADADLRDVPAISSSVLQPAGIWIAGEE